MGRKAKIPIEEKLRALEVYLSSKRGLSQIYYDLEVHKENDVWQIWPSVIES